MTVQQPNNPGDFVALRADRGSVANLQGVAAVVPRDGLLEELRGESASSAANLGNVVAFARARRGDSSAPPVVIRTQDRPAPVLPPGRPWLQGVLILCSLIIHGGAFYAFWQEPKPLEGIGIETITVEIEVGDNRPAGPASNAGPHQVDAKQVEEVKTEEKIVEQERVVDARELKPEETRTERAKEQTIEQPKELQKEHQAEHQLQRQPEQQQVVAMVETPQAIMPTVLPRETSPDAQATIAVRREQPKAARPAESKHKKGAQPSEAKVAAGGTGRTAVASLANYDGLVSAHLRRHQSSPRSGGATGSGAVTFSLSGSGSVTSVRIARSTGAAVLDQEILAMVRRASPFPAPPDGQPKSFTVPLNFTVAR
jgi:periplasmic protein TonB